MGEFILKTVAVDFDGVIHSYTSRWQGATVIPDPPVPGAIKFLNRMARNFKVAIYSTRAETREGRMAILEYLREHGVEDVDLRFTITALKPPAVIYIDDRGWQFTGSNWPSVDEVNRFLPWNKGGA